MIRKFLYRLFFLACTAVVLYSSSAIASSPVSPTQLRWGEDGLYVDSISVDELMELFSKFNYNDYIYMPNWEYPPIFLTKLPYDFNQIEDENERNNLFLRILIPLSLKVNEDILDEREQLIDIMQHFKEYQFLSDEQKETLDSLAEKYDVFTRLQGLRRYTLIMDLLNEKIDIIPPSILLTIAAIETNWGTSKSSQQANSLYKELIWYTDDGMVADDFDDSYRVRIFDSLYASMYSFALTLNSNINYEVFRNSRINKLKRKKPPTGRQFTKDMLVKSPLENYAGMVDYTLTFYELINIDSASLGFGED